MNAVDGGSVVRVGGSVTGREVKREGEMGRRVEVQLRAGRLGGGEERERTNV